MDGYTWAGGQASLQEKGEEISYSTFPVSSIGRQKCLCSHKHPPHPAACSVLHPKLVELLKVLPGLQGDLGGLGLWSLVGVSGRKRSSRWFFSLRA